MTPALKTSRRLLLWNSVRYTFPKTAVLYIYNTNVTENIAMEIESWEFLVPDIFCVSLYFLSKWWTMTKMGTF